MILLTEEFKNQKRIIRSSGSYDLLIPIFQKKKTFPFRKIPRAKRRLFFTRLNVVYEVSVLNLGFIYLFFSLQDPGQT